jgi:hypothetical protein
VEDLVVVRRYFSNTAAPTTLTAGITSGATSVTVASLSGWPTSYPFTAAIERGTANEELVSVTNTNVPGLTITMTRGYGGTTAKAHSLGVAIEHVGDATDFDEANAHVNATSGVHGATGAVVGTTDSQTVTNKTISSSTNLATTTDPGLTTKAASSGTALQIKALDSAGSVTLFSVARDGAAIVAPTGTASTIVTAQGPASQTGDFYVAKNSSATVVFSVDKDGDVTAHNTGGTIASTVVTSGSQATSSGAETLWAALQTAAVLVSGRKYKLTLTIRVDAGNAAQGADIRIRNSKSASAPTTSSTMVADWRLSTIISLACHHCWVAQYTADTTGTNTFGVSAIRQTGTNEITMSAGPGSTAAHALLLIEDLGV